MQKSSEKKRTRDDDKIATDDQNRKPNGQTPLSCNPDRPQKHDSRDQKQLIRDRIQNPPQMALLLKMSRNPPIHSIRQGSQRKKENRRIVPSIPPIPLLEGFPMIE